MSFQVKGVKEDSPREGLWGLVSPAAVFSPFLHDLPGEVEQCPCHSLTALSRGLLPQQGSLDLLLRELVYKSTVIV